MIEIAFDLATLVGLASSSVGMTGILSAQSGRIRTLGEVTVAAGVATIVMSGISAGA